MPANATIASPTTTRAIIATFPQFVEKNPLTASSTGLLPASIASLLVFPNSFCRSSIPLMSFARSCVFFESDRKVAAASKPDVTAWFIIACTITVHATLESIVTLVMSMEAGAVIVTSPFELTSTLVCDKMLVLEALEELLLDWTALLAALLTLGSCAPTPILLAIAWAATSFAVEFWMTLSWF